MPSENSKDECFSQSDRSDDDLDLLAIVNDVSNDGVVLTNGDASVPSPSASASETETNEPTQVSEPKVSSPSAVAAVKPTTTATVGRTEIYRARPLASAPVVAESKTNAKPAKPNQPRKSTNNRHRSNKRTSFKSNNRTPNPEIDKKWVHDKFEMLYNSKSSPPTNVEVCVTPDNSAGSNVDEIKDCIVSKLHSLTLSKPEESNNNASSKSTPSAAGNSSQSNNNSSSKKSDNGPPAANNFPRKPRDSNHNAKNPKPALAVVVTDNTKKCVERKSPTDSPPLQLNRVESPKVTTTAATSTAKNGESPSTRSNRSHTPVATSSFKLLPLQTSVQSSNNHDNVYASKPTKTDYKQPPNNNNKEKPVPYHPRPNTKKYFDAPKNLEPRPFKNSHADQTTSYQPTPQVDDVPAATTTSYTEQPTYYMDQGYYYYSSGSPYYPPPSAADMVNIPYQPNVYYQQGYPPNMYYNDSGIQSQYPYYNQPIYDDGVYYQPTSAHQMDTYYAPDQQFYHNYRGNNYRWNGRSNYHQNRSSRRHGY